MDKSEIMGKYRLIRIEVYCQISLNHGFSHELIICRLRHHFFSNTVNSLFNLSINSFFFMGKRVFDAVKNKFLNIRIA